MKRLVTICAVVTMLMMTVSASASMVSYTDSISGLFDQVVDRDLVVSQFDSSLGTLNSVSITVSTALQASLGIENTNPSSPASGTKAFNVYTYFTSGSEYYDTGASVTLSFDGSAVSTAAYTDATKYVVNLSKYDGVTDYAGTSGTTVVTFTPSNSNALFYNSGLASFIGTGSLTFGLVSDAHTSLRTPSNFSTSMSTTGQAGVTVNYDYTPTPEPATIGLLGLGALSLIRRKRRA